MLRVALSVRIRAGQQAEFERVWQEVAAAARLVPGNLGQALLQDVRDPANYVISSNWSSEEAFHDFERSPEQDELTKPIRDLRESAAMSLYTVVGALARPGSVDHDAAPPAAVWS